MSFSVSTVVFDLDGTLVESHKNIYNATIYAFDKLQVQYNMPEAEFYKKIGHHFEDIFDDFGIKLDDYNEFMTIYKKAYYDFIDSSTLYPDVKEVIEELKSRGLNIALLTTKGQEQADWILQHFNLARNFKYIMGRRPGIAHKPAPDMLLKICDELNTKPESAMMIGDSELDIKCGQNAGSVTCGVTYGYREKEFLQDLHPDFLIDEFKQLLTIL